LDPPCIGGWVNTMSAPSGHPTVMDEGFCYAAGGDKNIAKMNNDFFAHRLDRWDGFVISWFDVSHVEGLSGFEGVQTVMVVVMGADHFEVGHHRV